MILVAPGFTQPNPTYSYWLRVDQLIWAWIFATISKDMSCEVRNISYALPIWRHLGHHFNTANLVTALDLKCMLTNVSKSPDQSMDDYLRHIKTLTDSLAAIQSSVSDLELIQYTTPGLSPDYHHFATTYSMMPGSHTFNDLRSKLIFMSNG